MPAELNRHMLTAKFFNSGYRNRDTNQTLKFRNILSGNRNLCGFRWSGRVPLFLVNPLDAELFPEMLTFIKAVAGRKWDSNRLNNYQILIMIVGDNKKITIATKHIIYSTCRHWLEL